MENDEKRKKVIDELERRKKIVEDYFDSVDDSSKDSDPYGNDINNNYYPNGYSEIFNELEDW